MFTHKGFVAFWLSLLALAASAERIDRPVPEAAQLCVNCHIQTPDQQLSLDAQMTPLLSSQQAYYLDNALRAYSRRQRDHFFMRGIAAGLDEQQRTEVVSYFASGPTGRSTQPPPEMPEQAMRCVACHGDGRQRPVSTDTPILAGQHALYLTRSFESYATGKRRHPVMQAQAADADGQQTLAGDPLAAVAHWFSRLSHGVSGQ